MSAAGLNAPAGERDRIILAFVEHVADHGYADLDPDLISDRAGLPPGAFQHHFPDPCACFLAAWDRLEAGYLTRLDRVRRDRGPWREQLRACLLETVRLTEDHPRPARFLTVASFDAPAPECHRRNRLAARLRSLLDSARSSLEDPAALPEATADWVLAIFFDRIYRHLSSAGGLDLTSELPQLMFLAVSAYFGAEVGLFELGVPPV